MLGVAAVLLGCDAPELPTTAKQSPAVRRDDASAPAASQSAPAPGPAAAADPSLPSRRGFALHDVSNEAAYVLVKADAAKVADAVAAQMGGKVAKDAYGKPVDEGTAGTIVFQLAGHPWSMYAI